MSAAPGPELRDIHLPAEPAWWPPAPGWWLLALLALVAAGWVYWWARRRARVARARRALHKELAALRRAHPADSAAAEQVAALSLLLRRAAKRHAPQALALRDEQWLAFLDGDAAGQPFRRGAGRLLLDGPYRRVVDPREAEALAAVVEARLDRFVERADA